MTINYKSLAINGVQNLQPYMPGKPIDELERELGVSNTLKLASNENPMGPSPLVLEALDKAKASIQLYPDGNGFILKQKLSNMLKVNQNQITLGNGSNDVLDMIARTFLCEGREAIYSRYAFAVYPISIQSVNATGVVAEALPVDHETNPYGHDLTAMKDLINDKTRVIFIANPNNPTGTWLKSDELHEFISAVPKDIIVVVDEAYFEYVQEGEYPDTLQWLEEFPNLIVTRTFSKIYALAGLRVGYAVCSAEIADLLNRVRHPFNVNAMAIEAATAALNDQDHLENCVDINTKGIKFWRAACQYRGLDYIPTVGNFITIDMEQNAVPLYEAMLKEAVIVRPIPNYGLPNHLRITISTAEENQRCLDALDVALEQYPID
ncbi:histidinol-phosphate transaminase [Cocleimonas flava]|uniref:Histidinol-phosphate aminotransferase n=1 Tax=Cocleimonas flava TaxID=634765 RepID=A0A4R1F897_9GAMM|nr:MULTISPECIES: histidinol-phosphate transaminase [Cocleimonas]MEB8432195.1 histidinol-phosphate transaminase [Cocleimonas sp. KMM 6892]MEC4714719.1 histidinol-phosphate transaminase [Cocleimonas sp. KMM 6895]MEC4744467.1 histidinol-phosphate transaminase [Cocleimonas sp. KMM 6896]TCJ86941.1 histidinol-phosphate aminotransferase [Cocleimonas flava]